MRAVVIRFSSLGDVVLSTAVVQALSEAEWEIAFLTKNQYVPLLKHDPRIETVIKWDGFFATARRIKAFQPDWVIDLHANQRSFLLSSLIGVPVCRTRKHSIRRRMIVTLSAGDRRPKSVVDMHLDAISKIGIANKTAHPRVFVSNDAKQSSKKRLVGVEKPIAMLHCGAKHPLKNWGQKRFARLAKILEENGFSVVMLACGNDTKETLSVNNIMLEELVGLISFADLFVGNDSGPVHIAASLNVPTLAIFGPTHPALGFVPVGEFADYITADVPCSPCTLHGRGKCRKKSQQCFDLLTPTAIAEKAIKTYYKKNSKI